MERHKIELIKGQGIAFRDDKKVYVKGSEIGYAMATIEKILSYPLEQRQQLQLRIELTSKQETIREKMSDDQKLKQVLRSFLKDSSSWSNSELKEYNKSQLIPITQDNSAKRILAELIRPGLQRQINQELLRDNESHHRQRQQRSLGL